jgi:hypothetical protein
MTPSGVASEAAGDGKAEHRRLLRSDGPHRSSSFCQPGDVVITDNLSPYENAETRCLIQQRGADVLFLPPYSLYLNPIEKMWSKLKEFLRTAQGRTPAERHPGDCLGFGGHHTTGRHQLVLRAAIVLFNSL